MADTLYEARHTFAPTSHDDVPVWVNDYFAHVAEEFRLIAERLLQEPTHVEPFRHVDGQFAFADGTDWDPGFGRGIYYWDSNEGIAGEWVKVASAKKVLENFVAAGYGGIGLDALTALATIDTTWQELDMDTHLIATPLNVAQDLATNSMSFLAEGVWQISVKIGLTFAGQNAGRQLLLRLYNIDTGTPGANEFVFFIGRNQDGTNLNLTINVETFIAAVNDRWVIQVSSAADTFVTPVQIGSIFQGNHVSEFKGTL